MRLPNGFGSIYKKSGNRRNPYVAVVTTGWDENSKQIRKVIGYESSSTKALKLLNDYHNIPYNLDYKNITFKEIWDKVEKELTEKVNNNKMSKNNLDCLSFAFYNHLKPLHNKKILDIKYQDMQIVIDTATIRNSKQLLGHTAKGYMVTACRKIFNYAIDIYEMPILKNPTEKLSAGEKPKSNKHRPYTDEELNTLWNMQDNDIIKIILIWCYTGLRPNELFITIKENIHLEENYFITGSKTEAGKNRIIPIHTRIKPLIEYFYVKENKTPFNTLFKTNNNYNKFKREFNKLMIQLNWQHTPYDSRHTFATNMKRVNANEYILKIIMGHSIQDLTENTYTHRQKEELLNEVLKLK